MREEQRKKEEEEARVAALRVDLEKDFVVGMLMKLPSPLRSLVKWMLAGLASWLEGKAKQPRAETVG